jgi:hypothetical protein
MGSAARAEHLPKAPIGFSPGWFKRALMPTVPFSDPYGLKGAWAQFARAQPIAWKTVSLAPPGWDERAENLHIAVLADLHIGSHTDDADRLVKIVATVNRRKPDLVLLLGDYVNMQPLGGGRIPPSVIACILEGLEAPLGIHAVLGNHDYNYGRERIVGAFDAAGIKVLENRSRRIMTHKGDFNLFGLADTSRGVQKLSNLLEDSDSDMPGIIMAHDPASFAYVPRGPYLTVSGHTHGGQIRLPRIGALTNSSKAPLAWSTGHVVERDRHLYVSNGIGTSLIPFRFGCPPEVNFIHLGGAGGL